MTVVISIYIFFLIAFLIVSSLLFRQAIKFGYLSPSFRIVVIIFAILSLAVISFSFYLISQTGVSTGYEHIDTGGGATTGGLNF